MINIKQFAEIELKTARVLSAERVPETDKLVQLRVDVGDEERSLVAGIAAVYEPEQLVGMNIIIVTNLEPATIRGVHSEGMLLAADVDGRPIVATFPEDVPPGKRVR